MTSYAYAKKYDIEHGWYPASSIDISPSEWETLQFKHMILDSSDPTPFVETDHPDGFNMILLHPETKVLFWGYTADFDYTE